MGDDRDGQQTTDQQEPACQQAQQSGKQTVSFVINLQQRINMNRAEQGEDAQNAVLTEDGAVTGLYQQGQQQAHQQHAYGPLSPEGESPALGYQSAMLRSHRMSISTERGSGSNPRGLVSDLFRGGQVAIVFVVVAVLACLVQVDLVQHGTHDWRLVLQLRNAFHDQRD